MQVSTTINKAERNLNIVKELFTAICNGDAATMERLYHKDLQAESVKRATKNKKEIMYVHLFFYRLSQNQDIVDPNPQFKIINENTIKVLYDMYILRPNKKSTYYNCPIFFTLKDNQVIKEVHKNSALNIMQRRFLTYGTKSLLFAVPFLPYDRKEIEKEKYYVTRFMERQELLRLAEAPIQLRKYQP